MFGVPDQIPSQPSRIPSQSVRVSSYLGFRVTDPSQSAGGLDPLLVRAMPFCPPNVSASWPSGAFHYHKGVGPQGHRQARATEPAPEAPVSRGGPPGGVGSTSAVGRAKCIPEHTRGRLLTEQTAVRLESLYNIRFMSYYYDSYILHNI